MRPFGKLGHGGPVSLCICVDLILPYALFPYNTYSTYLPTRTLH